MQSDSTLTPLCHSCPTPNPSPLCQKSSARPPLPIFSTPWSEPPGWCLCFTQALLVSTAIQHLGHVPPLLTPRRGLLGDETWGPAATQSVRGRAGAETRVLEFQTHSVATLLFQYHQLTYLMCSSLFAQNGNTLNTFYSVQFCNPLIPV